MAAKKYTKITAEAVEPVVEPVVEPGTQFQAGEEYSQEGAPSFRYTVVKVSPSRKTLTVAVNGRDPQRKKIYISKKGEYLKPYGSKAGHAIVHAWSMEEPLLEISFNGFLKNFKDKKFLARFHRAYDKAPAERREAFESLPEGKKISMFQAKYKNTPQTKHEDIEALKRVIKKRKERGCDVEVIRLLLQNKIDAAATKERKQQLLEILAAEAPATPECRQMDSIVAACKAAQGNYKQALLTIETLKGIRGVDNKIKFHVKQTPAPYKMRLKVARYDGTCEKCGEEIPRGATMAHEKRTGCFCPACAPLTVEEVRAYREKKAEAKAERLEEWARKREIKAEATLESNKGDSAYNTQPGYVPGRERGNQQDRRAFKSLDKAAEMRGRANSLRSNVPVKGDAERRRQAKREELDKVIFKGSRVHESIFGPGVVTRKNKKTYTIKFDSGCTYAREKSFCKLEA